jgi:integrase
VQDEVTFVVADDPLSAMARLHASEAVGRRHAGGTISHARQPWGGGATCIFFQQYAAATLARLEKDVFPFIGRRPLKHLDAADFLECLQRIENVGVRDTAHKMKTKCSEIMRYAVVTRRVARNPLPDLKGALMPAKRKHYATITYPSEVRALMRTIHGYGGKSQIVHCALRLLPLVVVRSSELRHARWQEFDLEGAQWKIPAERHGEERLSPEPGRVYGFMPSNISAGAK